MSHLTSEQRNKLPDSKFALPGERKYPVNNASHAANAKARASQQFNKGNLSASEKAQIDRRANEVLGGAEKVAKAMMGGKR
jgi:hypothetical protein